MKGIDVREAFEKELAGILELLTEMAVKAGAAMNTATRAMLDADPDAAKAVIAGDDDLDDLTGRIEHACYDAVARQQPVARDLRLVVSAMQISSSLERMGDLADHVAKRALMRHPGRASRRTCDHSSPRWVPWPTSWPPGPLRC